MDEFLEATSDRQIEREDTTVHAFLKQLEVGETHRDTKTLQAL